MSILKIRVKNVTVMRAISTCTSIAARRGIPHMSVQYILFASLLGCLYTVKESLGSSRLKVSRYTRRVSNRYTQYVYMRI